ncbi:MAG: hypothetical protein HKN34_12470 [Gammaproteobacteria bacterium]|nr:hypothetical protein [Gammaproteobacteria bacterium]
MPKYNDSFTLDMHDVDLIEKALRVMWSEDEKKIPTGQSFPAKTPERIRNIHNLLGKISSQKIYYSEVNETSCPIG